MKNSLCLIIFLFVFYPAFTQEEDKVFSILFYNVENLFDIQNDSLTLDDEFTPRGDRHWNLKKLDTKLNRISKAVLSAAGWNTPSIIAMVEVENRYVLEQLIKQTPIGSFPYKIIHKESPDTRGIDVALLYNSNEFYPLEYQYIPLTEDNGEMMSTREILYVSGVLGGKDTIYLFANHWPSRYSGILETKELRNRAARLLRSKVDLIFSERPKAKVIIVGDFNDEPGNESMVRYLAAQSLEDEIFPDCLYNLSEAWKPGTGTLKYQGTWYTFDQIIVSGALLFAKTGLYVEPDDASICNLPFLLEKDNTYGGMKPSRTYNGMKYNGGFSDHLPVLIKIN